MAIAVSNSFNTTPAYSGSFIPTLWSGKLNAKFYATTVFGEIANTNWEGEVKNLGDKVTINNIPSITINDYTIGTNLTYEVPTPSTVDLTIDKAKYFGVNVSDVLEYQSKPNLMNMFTDDASMQMKIAIDQQALLDNYNSFAAWSNVAQNSGATAGRLSSSYDLGTHLAPITLSGSNILQKLTALSAVLDEQNVPETDRWLVLTPADRQVLMQSPLAQAQFMGDATSMVRNGRIGSIDRFTIYVSNLLPTAAVGKAYATTVGGTGANLSNALKRHTILAGHKTAITFASQIAKVESLQNPNDFGTLVRGLNVYGYKVVKNESMAVLQVAG